MLSQNELHRSLQVHMYICICICVRVLLLAVTLPYCFMPVDFAHFFMFRDYYSGYLFRFLVWGDILRTCEHVHVYGCTHVCPFLDDDAGYMYMCLYKYIFKQHTDCTDKCIKSKYECTFKLRCLEPKDSSTQEAIKLASGAGNLAQWNPSYQEKLKLQLLGRGCKKRSYMKKNQINNSVRNFLSGLRKLNLLLNVAISYVQVCGGQN